MCQILEVAQGLEYIHSEGVVHGDLSTVSILTFILNPKFVSSNLADERPP